MRGPGDIRHRDIDAFVPWQLWHQDFREGGIQMQPGVGQHKM